MEKIIKALSKVSDKIYKVQLTLLEIAVGILIIVNALQVCGRYFFSYSLPWSEQLSLVLFIFLIMFGGSLAMRTDTEIKITLLHFKSQKKNLIVISVVDFLALITIVLLFISSFMLTKQASELKQIISSLNLDYTYVYCILDFGFGIMAFEKFISFLKHVFDLKKVEEHI